MTKVAQMPTQTGWRVLQQAICAKTIFINQVYHPDMVRKNMQEVDEAVRNARKAILLENKAIAASEEEWKRANEIAELPTSLKGAGQTSAVAQAKCAWLASLAACALRHEKLEDLLPSLEKEVDKAVNTLTAAMREDGAESPEGAFPDNTRDFLRLKGMREAREANPRLKPFAATMRALHEARLSTILKRLDQNSTAAVWMRTTRSILTRVFTVPLSERPFTKDATPTTTQEQTNNR